MPALLTVPEVRDVYTRLAPFYGMASRWRAGKASRLGMESAAVRDGETVLELGVGSGSALRRLASENPSGTTIGVDLTPAMLERTSGLFRKQFLAPPNLCRCDARYLPFRAGSFDLIYSAFMLDSLNLFDAEMALHEIHRVLKPSGRLVLVHLSLRSRWFNFWWGLLNWTVPNLLGGCRPIQVAAYLSSAGFVLTNVCHTTQWGIPADVIAGVRGD